MTGKELRKNKTKNTIAARHGAGVNKEYSIVR